jgi:hypothetical protein
LFCQNYMDAKLVWQTVGVALRSPWFHKNKWDYWLMLCVRGLQLSRNWLCFLIMFRFTTGSAMESKYGSDHGANAHTDYGMLTLLSTDGTPGLQVCVHNSSALV